MTATMTVPVTSTVRLTPTLTPTLTPGGGSANDSLARHSAIAA
jgi:hypothetical protein